MMYKIRGFDYEVVYDNDMKISTPALCTDKNAKIVNNININGLRKLIESTDGLWNDESKNDFRDLLEYEPSDKILYAIGEIILAPKSNPDSYYKLNQTKKGDKTYLFVEKLSRVGGGKIKMKKERKTKQTKISVEPVPVIEEKKDEEKPKRTRSKSSDEEFIKKSNISLECFLMLRIAEALNDYARIVHPDEVKEYKRIQKK